jgi:hypothetical protein
VRQGRKTWSSPKPSARERATAPLPDGAAPSTNVSGTETLAALGGRRPPVCAVRESQEPAPPLGRVAATEGGSCAGTRVAPPAVGSQGTPAGRRVTSSVLGVLVRPDVSLGAFASVGRQAVWGHSPSHAKAGVADCHEGRLLSALSGHSAWAEAAYRGTSKPGPAGSLGEGNRWPGHRTAELFLHPSEEAGAPWTSEPIVLVLRRGTLERGADYRFDPIASRHRVLGRRWGNHRRTLAPRRPPSPQGSSRGRSWRKTTATF